MTDRKSVFAQVHLLGSKAGYRTLSVSAGVNSAEREQLEQLEPFRDIVGPAREMLQRSICAFVQRLDSGNFAIRRVFVDRIPDNHGRQTILVASLVLAAPDYEELAIVDAGRDGSGLDGIVHGDTQWERIRSQRGGVCDPILLSVPSRHGQWAVHDVDFAIFDAWHSTHMPGSMRQLCIRRGSEEEARLLAIPSLLPRSQVSRFIWGIGIMRAVHPGTVASYLVPEFEPSDACTVPREVFSPLASQARDLMQKFPESKWYSEADYQRLEQRYEGEIAENKRRTERHKKEIVECECRKQRDGAELKEVKRNVEVLCNKLREADSKVTITIIGYSVVTLVSLLIGMLIALGVTLLVRSLVMGHALRQ